MSNIKKIFISVSAVIMASILALIITLNCIKINVCIEFGKPIYVTVFNHSTVADIDENLSDEKTESKIIPQIIETTNLSAFDRLIKGYGLSKKIYIDDEEKFAKWDASVKYKQIVVEIVYNKSQDIVIYQNNESRVLSYFALALVIPESDEIDDIIVYYSNTNDSTEKETQYYQNTPFSIHANAQSFVEYIKSF